MEKLKTFFKTYYIEVIFGVLFILLLGFMALPFLQPEFIAGSYTFVPKTGEPEEKDAIATVGLSIFQLLAGGTFTAKGNILVNEATGTYQLFSIDVKMMPDVTVILSFILIIVGAILFIVKTFIKNEGTKKALIGTASACYLISIFFFIAIEKFIGTYDYLGGVLDGCDYVIYGYILVLFVLFALTVIVSTSIFKYVKFSVRDLTEIGLLVASALVLDKIKIDIVAGAGSINLAGIPLFLIALRHGPLKGLLAASVVFGLMSCLIDGYGLQTFPFDYFIAFSGYAVTGLAYHIFKTKIIKDKGKKIDLGFMILSFVIGAASVIITRMIGSGISSYIYFVDYLPEDILSAVGGSTFKAILLYNILYIGPSAAVSLLGCILLAKPIQMLNERFPIRRLQETQTSEEAK